MTDRSGDRKSFRGGNPSSGRRDGAQGDRGSDSGSGSGSDRSGGAGRTGGAGASGGRGGSYGGNRQGGAGQGGGPRQDGPRRRGGEGGFAGRSGDSSAGRRPPRPEEPDLPDDITPSDLDAVVRRDLLSLDKSNAEAVARHLVMVANLLDDDPRLALAHARAARQRAGRIAVVRETAGVAAYHAGEWAEALSELRAARRMAGGPGLLAVMADCERGLGRPERAIELGRSDEARALTGDDASELRIVVAGARMDLGEYDQAVVTLQTADLDPARTGPGPARLFYAYADALVAAGRTDEGVKWFLNSASADLEGDTDAEERVAELSGGSE
ncbi:tetratricopeptide repeat protein [Antrihabitans sp. NCIMB 15449]|uniref:Tetratricopeptide repeat protein n=1 Tax=Antrihabitans spumae TaxID=3373370 RepID=A0ABW7JU73_9NOCA